MNREIKELSKALESKEREQIQAEAVRDNLIKELKQNFGIASIEDAEKFIIDQEAKIQKKEAKLEESLEVYMENYGEALGLK